MSQHQLHMPSSLSDGPWNTPWPPNDLEHLAVCPVCGCTERLIIHKDLIDNVFHCAPGKWTSWRCTGCRCAYLDPRPSRASMHLAYVNYYTHQEAKPQLSYSALGLYKKLTRKLVNGYTNFRYSARETPAAPLLGPFVFMTLWARRMRLDREYRHLPRLPAGGGTLLDLGCGNGEFLLIAKSCGWEVVGIDPDPDAVSTGLRLGLNVRQGGIEQFATEKELFDVVTLSHVIEHVHDPVATLKAVYRLLKPGGQLWLETPNIDSLGHKHYMKNWRGLEPPRHLVLFNQHSLKKTLFIAGFRKIKNQSGPRPMLSITKASEAIKQGFSINDEIYLSLTQRWTIRKNELLQAFLPECKDFFTIVAHKSS